MNPNPEADRQYYEETDYHQAAHMVSETKTPAKASASPAWIPESARPATASEHISCLSVGHQRPDVDITHFRPADQTMGCARS